MILFWDWGLIDYQKAYQKQLEACQFVSQLKPELESNSDSISSIDGVVVFCQHPPIVTLGSKTLPEDVTTWSGPTLPVVRGGRATYHGPSQLVIYPILKLDGTIQSLPAKDVDRYLRTLEKITIEVLKDDHLQGFGKQGAFETGVWIKDLRGQDKKIASIGVGIKKWTTWHGIALNVFDDPKAFEGIKPCGLSPDTMTCLEKVIPDFDRKNKNRSYLTDLKLRFQKNFQQLAL